MYKLYNANLKHFKPFELPSLLLPEHEACTKELGLDYYHKFYDENIEQRYKNMSLKDENILLCEYSSFELFSFNNEACYAPNLALEKLVLKNSFKAFNAAIYQGFHDASTSLKALDLLGAKNVAFNRQFKSNGYELLHIDPETAFANAACIVFDAYDSGADFLVVEDLYSFIMFDTHAKELQRYMNRSLNDFYILSLPQLLSLGAGVIPKSLASNKLKAVLV